MMAPLHRKKPCLSKRSLIGDFVFELKTIDVYALLHKAKENYRTMKYNVNDGPPSPKEALLETWSVSSKKYSPHWLLVNCLGKYILRFTILNRILFGAFNFCFSDTFPPSISAGQMG